jgi:tRNA pseudouridine38-40 synthase
VEDALATLLGERAVTSVAGRTDAGVHARAQVVSFVTELDVEINSLVRSLNGVLGPEIAIASVAIVDDNFHARHSARWRRYRYRIGTRPGGDPLTRSYTWEIGGVLDVDSMKEAAGVYVGQHDFSSFCRTVEGRSNVRRVEESTLISHDDGVIEYWVRANAFCQQMVRSLAGHLYDIGRGFARAEDAAEVLEARDRSRVVTVAPPHGLTLWEVGY